MSANFPEMKHFEGGVHYFRDYTGKAYSHATRFEYTWHSPSGHTGVDHFYIELCPRLERRNDMRRLLDHFTRIGWTYKINPPPYVSDFQI